MKIDLTGKVAVVTGAAQGIGRAISLAFAEHGADIAAFDVKTIEAQKVVEETRKYGRKAFAFRVDVSIGSEVNSGVQKVLEGFRRIDILVNNAGIYLGSPVVDMPEEEWDRVVDISLKGAFLCSKAVAPTMIERRYGRIINLSSRAGRQGSQGHAHYAAAKAGILGFTKSLAGELGPYGITVNALAPGIIETEMTKDLLRRGERKSSDHAVGRYGQPEDLIGVSLLLASEHSGFITGATIDVNGGSWMG